MTENPSLSVVQKPKQKKLPIFLSYAPYSSPTLHIPVLPIQIHFIPNSNNQNPNPYSMCIQSISILSPFHVQKSISTALYML